MIDSFFSNSFLALLLIGASASLLGVFVLWKKLSYFGDAIAHSILLGAALGAIFNLQQNLSLIFFALLFAALVEIATKSRYFSKDTIITIASYFCISLAIFINDLTGKNLDFSNYLFGDISTVSRLNLYVLAAIFVAVFLFTILAFKKVLLINLAPDLAKIAGVKVAWWNSSFLVLLTLAVAVSVQIVGVLLMTALLVLPAAIARIFSSSALQMLWLSLLFSIMVCALSAAVASHYEISASALTVLIFSLIFIPTLLIKGTK